MRVYIFVAAGGFLTKAETVTINDTPYTKTDCLAKARMINPPNSSYSNQEFAVTFSRAVTNHNSKLNVQ